MLKKKVRIDFCFVVFFLIKKLCFIAECGTQMVVDLFVKSINSTDIKAKNCGDYISFTTGKCKNNKEILFGENVNKDERGIYFLDL